VGLAAGVLALATLTFVGVFGWEQFWAKLHGGGDDRMRIYAGAVDLIRERPWTGFGLGTWTTVYPAYAHFDEGLFMNAAHNDWLQWAGDGGLLTAAVLLILAASTLPRAFRSVWGIGIPVLFLHAVVDFPFQLPALVVTLFTLLGALAASGSAAAKPSELSPGRWV
jgi:O-antigen ligase